MFSSDELQRRKSLNERGHWEIPEGLDTSNFDFTWRPDVYERPYIHQFGTQWQKTGGPKFIVPENEGVKYHDFQKAVSLPNQNNRCWRPLVANAVIDYSWHPDETDPPYIYVFGNQWYDCYTMPTFQYRVKGATEKKYITDVKAKLLPNKENWVIPDDVDDTDFDYSWVPNPHEPPLTHEFGTQWQINGGPKYVAPNSIGVKYQSLQKVNKLPNIRNWRMIENIQEGFDYSWHPDNREPAMMYEFGTQWQPAGGPIYTMKNATHKKYCSDQIAVKTPSHTRFFRPLINNIEFDYSWHPNPNDPPYIYVFGNQWYGPEIMPTLLYRVPNATEKKYITEVKAKLLPNKENWVIPDDIDDSNFDYSWVPHPDEPDLNWQFGTQWQKTGGPLYVNKKAIGLKYTNAQRVNKLPNYKCWRVFEPINDEAFDYTWHPDSTEGNYNYIFGNQYHSGEHMPTLMYKMNNAIGNKYINEIKPQLKIEQITYEDSIFDAMINHDLSTTYTGISNFELDPHKIISDSSTPYIHIIDNSAAIVPKNAKIKTYDKLEDYPYVKHHVLGHTHTPLDIIFISNGEQSAEENYEYLVHLTRNLPNRLHRIKDVYGRVASQHAAANVSSTPWYFLINAKCRVNSTFDFSWQPNRMVTRKHYIFTATNPLNNLEYGHMAIVANNKKLTLSTLGTGLDFTLESPNSVININSGIGLFNTSEWDTWRTAFREVLKLKYQSHVYHDAESTDRLNVWLSIANGEFAEWAIRGAKDAVEYYASVNGEFSSLKLSYDWNWLREKFENIKRF